MCETARPRDSFDPSPSAADVAEKQRYAEVRYAQEKQQATGSVGLANAAVRFGLRERVNTTRRRAQRESDHVDLLRELADLLERNPEVARILELIEQTGV